MRIHYFSPFSVEKDFLKELDYYFSIMPSPNDWACLRDGDTMFVRPDFGMCIMDYILKYPGTGMFTCYASRCHYKVQVPDIGDMNNPSVEFHAGVAKELQQLYQPKLEVDVLQRRIAGHMMLIRKNTWIKIRAAVFHKVRTKNKKILGVDTQISNAVLQAGMDIKLMKGIYLVHYLRMNEGMGNTNHLL